MLEKAANLTDEEFEEKRKSVLIDLSEKKKNMAEAFSAWRSEISNFRFCWDIQEQEIDMCKSVTKQEWQAFYAKTFSKETAKRLDLTHLSKAHK